MPSDALTVVLVHPELLGLYGDRGNALALRRRALLRGLAVEVLTVPVGATVPTDADVYLLGGAEDSSMGLAHQQLVEDRGLKRAIERGAPTLAVCAGMQLLAEEYRDQTGRLRAGLGVLDVRCDRLPGHRAVGEVLATAERTQLGELTGFENHQGDARLGPQARPLGRVRRGTGNGDGVTEGAVQGSVVATYMHGPVLVRNPLLADWLLAEAVGGPLPAIREDLVIARLRHERIDSARRRRPWARRP